MIRTRAVALAPTGRSFAAATTEGLLLYTLDQGLVFDPTDLAQDVTPEAAHAALAKGQALRAALIALRLRDGGLLRHALLSTPPEQVRSCICVLLLKHLLDCLCSRPAGAVLPITLLEKWAALAKGLPLWAALIARLC